MQNVLKIGRIVLKNLMDEIHEMYAFYFGNVQCHILKFRRALMIIDELKQLTKVVRC
jgi:hypothetical protein